MEITYHGHSCFKIKGKQSTLVFDPFDPAQIGLVLPKLSCDVLLISHEHFDHNYVKGVSDYKLLIQGPGEYESNGVFVRGMVTFHDNKEGTERGKNTIYLVEIDDFNVLHLGDLGHELSKETLEKISNVDVLLIPVGGKYTINAQSASRVISSLEPSFVIPMHYKNPNATTDIGLEPLSNFLSEMGIKDELKKADKFKISGKNDLVEETQVEVLNITQ